MNALFVNIPFIKHDDEGNIYTGPNAGSRWPWTQQGITAYACFPFFMAYAVSYLRLNGIDADMYDAVALRHWYHELVKKKITEREPDIIFFETSTPLFNTIRGFARWAKESLGCRVVMVGPHVAPFAEDLIREPFVDHCVAGEYEIPSLKIASDPEKAQPIYRFEHLEDIDRQQGVNFLPYRPNQYLDNYWEPTMNTQKAQLQVNTSRGCPFKCTYCMWPKVMNNGRYRARSPEMVIDEITTVIRDFATWLREDRGRFAPARYLENANRNLRGAAAGRIRYPDALRNTARGYDGIQSILFDDDTWNVGKKRVIELCDGLKGIGLPWTIMGRIDTSPLELYDLMVDSGCVGMRFGIETFNQRLSDNVKKRMDTKQVYENIKYLITRFTDMEFHFTTMQNLPGEAAGDWDEDLRVLEELKAIGKQSRNIIHWQTGSCVAFPGTELWEEMVELGKGDVLGDFDLYDGCTQTDSVLAKAVGWLGEDYKPKRTSYSGMGEPEGIPDE
jgi:radical SAM superfamily enzyme YgiQ (UPF0313 family)